MISSSLIPLPTNPAVAERVARIELPWNTHRTDPYGIDQGELAQLFTLLGFFYRRYFEVKVYGAHHIPPKGRAMLVGNHSGGWALDATMVIASAFFELDPPRLAQGMAEKFIQRMPFLAWFTSRIGQFTGLPENAVRLLEDERLLMVFPEGARGTAKLYKDRDSLVGFGTGFVRLALRTRTPIVPFAFVGGGEAVPTIANLYKLGHIFGVPYVPVTPWGVAVPLPVTLQLLYGAPIMLEGDPDDTDDVIIRHVERIKRRITDLIAQARQVRDGKRKESDLVLDDADRIGAAR
jgi:1-acyl-sn-glycerol-3-phosphate acyltransferase